MDRINDMDNTRFMYLDYLFGKDGEDSSVDVAVCGGVLWV